MENALQIFNHEDFGNVRIRLDEYRNVEINLEDAARGLGFTQTQNKGGKTYTSIRWERVNGYLAEIGFSPTNGGNAYIPESIFYLLAMKASNDAAVKFQRWIAFDVIPSIRKYGAYMTPTTAEEIIANPDFLIQLATALKAERAKVKQLEAENAVLLAQNQANQHKADYFDKVLACKGLVAVSVIAKDYGYSAVKFNRLLHELGVQYQQGGMWLLYDEYAKRGWAQSETYYYLDSDDNEQVNFLTKWTQKGRLGLYELLKQNGILPICEKLSGAKRIEYEA